MLKTIPVYFQRLWRYVRRGISFIPGLYVFGFIVFALVLAWGEHRGLSHWIREHLSLFVVDDKNTSRTILSIVIGGLVSLTVFSFSQVMVVLGQATSTLSPRLLPQLIQDRSHQTVLGTYLGVIVFSFITLINLERFEKEELNGFSVFLSVLMAIICLAMFVYFIASISKRIQVGQVIHRIRREALSNIDYWISQPDGWKVIEALPTTISDWNTVVLPESGYLDLPTYNELANLAAEYDTLIFLDTYRSSYILAGTPILRMSRTFSEAEKVEIASKLNLSKDAGEVWYLQSIRHITEVAVKAMSPGINDPGTALESIDMLADILRKMLEIPPYNQYTNEDNGGKVFFHPVSFETVLRIVFQELRCYAKSDPVVVQRMILALYQLRHIAAVKLPAVCRGIDQEVAILEEDIRLAVANSHDRSLLLDLMSQKRWEAQKEKTSS